MADRVGQRLGNYQLIQLLGSGAFAEVYLGEQIYLKTQAAIKVLHTRLADRDLEGFLAEARTIARLVHPHIVRVLEFGEEDSIPYLVMDHAPNGTLRQRHSGHEPLPLQTMLPYVKQVAAALQYAHYEKVIHRDVKPENMLVGRNNDILLSDFGIATIAQNSTYQQTGGVAGTVAYMAPEQIQGKPRPSSDQYALAITVYEWLTGNRPFRGSLSEIAAKQVMTQPPSLRAQVPAISQAVEEVVLTALAKDPRQRFGSVQAFANALEQASKITEPRPSLSTQAGPPPAPGDAPEWAATVPLDGPLPTPVAYPVRTSGPNTAPPAQPTWNTAPVYGAPQPPSGPQQGISRRTLIVAGLAGAALLGGGATVFALSQHTASPGVTETSTPTATPNSVSNPTATPTHTPTPTHTVPTTHITNVQIGTGDSQGNITNQTTTFTQSDRIIIDFTATTDDPTAQVTLQLLDSNGNVVPSDFTPLTLVTGQHDYFFSFTITGADHYTAQLQYNGTTEQTIRFTVT